MKELVKKICSNSTAVAVLLGALIISAGVMFSAEKFAGIADNRERQIDKNAIIGVHDEIINYCSSISYGTYYTDCLNIHRDLLAATGKYLSSHERKAFCTMAKSFRSLIHERENARTVHIDLLVDHECSR